MHDGKKGQRRDEKGIGDPVKPQDHALRFQADETPPAPLAFGLGLQLTTLSVSVTVLITTIVFRAAGQDDAYLAWAVFAAVLAGGACTMLQPLRFGRLGMGHVLMMGSATVFIPVCIEALVQGGPGMLATLIVVSALFQFLISEYLPRLRRILTPAVSGTVLMLLPISVITPVFNLLEDVPPDSPVLGAPISAIVTVLVFCGFALMSTGKWRLWAPVLGALAGSLVAAAFGLYDTGRVAQASWIGLPPNQWQGHNLDLGASFWTLLPGFLLAAMIGSIRTFSSAAAAQRVSWRRPRAIDFRAIQGAVATDAVGNLFCGFCGTVPNTAYSTGASLAQITGVASRNVGIAAGAVFLAIAFLPKALALLLAIPSPVFAAYLAVMLAVLFMIGVQMIVQDGIDHRKSLIVGVSFIAGVGFQNDLIFPDFFSGFAGSFINNGMTAGGLVAILMTLIVRMSSPSSTRLKAQLGLSALPELRQFLHRFAADSGWDQTMSERLDAVGEETLLTLLEEGRKMDSPDNQLAVSARREQGQAVLEFIAAPGKGGNLQDQIALLEMQVEEARFEEQVSLRILRHLTTSIHHHRYHGMDIVTIRVDPPEQASAAHR
ncbi:MAG: hypothetical protein F4093_09480 [Gammaproteobacteria bacterium]|nr:hypothetical protein [Gammaproteobacteria bacterium]